MKKLFTLLAALALLGNGAVGQNCLKAYYPFTTNALDASGNGHDGTINGATLTADKDANANSAYSFDGIDNEIVVSDHADLQISTELTIAAWVYLDQNFSQKGNIIEKGMTNNWEWGLRVEDSLNVLFLIFNPTGTNNYSQIYSSNKLPKQTWTHVAAVFDDNNFIKLYINGVLDSTSTVFNTGFPYGVGTSPVNIGIRKGWIVQDPAFPFNGKLDEIRLYNCALNATEIDLLVYPVGINENTKNTKFTIYPNPTEGKFRVESLELGVEKVAVYDLFGRLVLSSTTPQIDMRGYAKGVYVVKAGQAVRKLVKQ